MSMPKFGLALFVSSIVIGQTFEVASVKPSTPQERDISLLTYPGGRITVRNFTLKQLIEQAYGVQRFQVSGPAWIDVDRYSIEARPPAGSESSRFSPADPKTPPPKEELLMLRALLADRFQLKLHRATKEGAVYSLVAGNKGPNLQPAKNTKDRPWVGNGFESDPDGQRRIYYIAGQNASMPLLAERLGSFLRRPVNDDTRLTGSFDFKFTYEEDETFGSIVTAIQSLGLKLESRKGAVETLIVDHAEKPSAN